MKWKLITFGNIILIFVSHKKHLLAKLCPEIMCDIFIDLDRPKEKYIRSIFRREGVIDMIIFHSQECQILNNYKTFWFCILLAKRVNSADVSSMGNEYAQERL